VNPLPTAIRRFEFYYPHLDTLLQVEVQDEEVTVRASRDTFSVQRKICFIRELAAEGFIPDECPWFSLAGPESSCRGVHWRVDIAWLKFDEAAAARTRRFVLKLLAGATLLLALLLGLMVTGHLGNVRVSAPEVRQEGIHAPPAKSGRT
jgi:hypothetical protein